MLALTKKSHQRAFNIGIKSRKRPLDSKNVTSLRANECARSINQFRLRMESAEEKSLGGFAFINYNFAVNAETQRKGEEETA